MLGKSFTYTKGTFITILTIVPCHQQLEIAIILPVVSAPSEIQETNRDMYQSETHTHENQYERHIGLTNTMATVSADDGALVGACDAFDGAANVTVHGARLDQCSASLEALEGSFDKALGILVYLSDKVSFVQIAVVTILVDRHVDVDDVTLNEFALIGDSVADDLVDRGA